MCTDEAPYATIDAIAAAAIDPAKNLEDAAGSCGLRLIAAERARQIRAKGWTAEHDDTHGRGELAQAATAYAWPHNLPTRDGRRVHRRLLWPWDDGWREHAVGERVHELAKAGALIAAEIDRIERAACPSD